MDNYSEFFKRDKFAAVNGISLIECQPGFARTMVEVNEDHYNSAKVAHGGLIFTLADFAFAAAVNSYGTITLSITNTITYFHKCDHGILTAEARVISRSNRLINCDINIIDGSGRLVANFKGTAYITKQEIKF